MSAKATAIAEAVIAQLQAGTWPLAFTPTLARARVLDAATDLASLQVTVSPQGRSLARGDRGSNLATYTVSIFLQQAAGEQAVEEAILDTAEAIADALAGNRLAVLPEALVREVRHEPLFSVEQLREKGILTTVLVLTIEQYETRN